MNLIAMNFLSDLGDMLVKFGVESGFAQFFNGVGWKNLIMIGDRETGMPVFSHRQTI